MTNVGKTTDNEWRGSKTKMSDTLTLGYLCDHFIPITVSQANVLSTVTYNMTFIFYQDIKQTDGQL